MSDVKNFQDSQAIEKLRALGEGTRTAMFCTNLAATPFFTCPMTTQQVDDAGAIWFFSAKDSQHNGYIAADNRVQLIYANNSDASYLTVFGQAEILFDRAKVAELWSPLVKTWFPEGQDDPNLSLIKVSPQEGYYWDTKNGKMVSFLKMLASVVSGKTMDDSIQGALKV